MGPARWVAAALLALAAARVECRAGGGPALFIGDGWAVLRDSVDVSPAAADAEILLEGIPPEADEGSLVLRGRRPLDQLEWERVAAAPRAGAAREAGEDVVWDAGRKADAARVGPVRALVRFADAGTRTIDYSVMVTGMMWHARYQLLIRGDFDKEDEPLSTDIEGYVVVSNGTSRFFTSAIVALSGHDTALPQSPGKPPGFLMLGDMESPLADIWKKFGVERGTGHAYLLPGAWDVPARGEAALAFFAARRRPLDRIYRMDPAAEGVERTPEGRGLRKFIVFRNRTPQGPGPDLPAGRAQIYLGSLRTTLNQEAWFTHTPANGEIRVDLGLTDAVRGTRAVVARTPVESGSYTESVEIRLRNSRKGDVDVEIEERPASTLAWDVIRANRAWERRGQSLTFRTQARGGEETVVTYTLRYKQPQE